MPLECTITLDKNGGVNVTVFDEKGKVTQTVVMDGTTITLTVAGENEKETSRIVQTKAGVTITCGLFEVVADEVKVTTKGDLALTSQGRASVEAASVALTSKGIFTSKAEGVMNIEGSITNVKGDLVRLG
jgi:hypothetical protein